MAQSQTSNQNTQSTTPPAKESVKPSEFIFIENTTRAMLGVPKPVTKSDGGRPGAYVQDILINLKPGLNRVAIADWNVARRQQMIEIRINEGHLREVASIDSLRSVAPEEAKKLISGIVDKAQLLEWKELDPRKEIQKAIDQRLNDLEKPEPGAVPPSFRGGR
jgi:hypothetical protein